MKKNIFQWVISICMTLILGFSPEMSWGIKADRTPRQVELPDGSRLTVRLHGDEFFHYTTTSDGYMIARKKMAIITMPRMRQTVSLYIPM